MKTLTVSALVCAMMALTGATANSLQVTKPISCSDDWFQINSRSFYFVPQLMTWAEAERNCQSLGGHLASIHSLQQYQQIQRLTGVKAWIGGIGAEQKHLWFWSDGSPFTYNNWCPKEPRNKGWRYCLQINYSAGKCWDDIHCTGKRSSICAFRAW